MGRAFEYRKASKFARWDKMAKAFTKVSKEISMAVKAGGDNPENNAALRRAIQNGKSVQMPKDKVEAAIKRASSKGGDDWKTIFYDGMGPHGIAIIVETATDNHNRTAANIRSIFKKKGGDLGVNGMHDFMFESKGVFIIKNENLNNPEDAELELIDYGLESIIKNDTGDYEMIINFSDFGKFQEHLEYIKLEVESSNIKKIPSQTKTLIEENHIDDVLELIDALEQDDDVQNVYHNLEEN